MGLQVNKDNCIGCGLCTIYCPEVFRLDSDGLAMVYLDSIPQELASKTEESMEECPTGAIVICSE